MTWPRRSILFAAVLLWTAAAMPAAADFQVCNDSTKVAHVSVGYYNNETYLTRGWWEIPSSGCLVIYPGPLKWPVYYVYAISPEDEYGNFEVWSGDFALCIHRPNPFEITGRAGCDTLFFEIEAGESENMTFRLE